MLRDAPGRIGNSYPEKCKSEQFDHLGTIDLECRVLYLDIGAAWEVGVRRWSDMVLERESVPKTAISPADCRGRASKDRSGYDAWAG